MVSVREKKTKFSNVLGAKSDSLSKEIVALAGVNVRGRKMRTLPIRYLPVATVAATTGTQLLITLHTCRTIET
jgi:hypothetical protein